MGVVAQLAVVAVVLEVGGVLLQDHLGYRVALLHVAAAGVQEGTVEVVFDVVEGGLRGGQSHFAVADAAAALLLLALVLGYLLGQLGYPTFQRNPLSVPLGLFLGQRFLDLVAFFLYFL